MNTGIFLGAGLAALLALVFFLRRAGRPLWRFRGTRIVHCPETGGPAGVQVDLGQLAVTAVRGTPALRVATCSRWPAQQGCGQLCVAQLAQAPDESNPKVLLTRWYEGKSCALCDAPFGPIRWVGDRPGLMRPDGHTLEWCDVRVEQLPDVLAVWRPVCWKCHIAETFRRLHPRTADSPWNRYAAWAVQQRAARAER